MILRAILVALFVLLAAAHVVRTAAVAAFADAQPLRAAAFWASHPDTLRSVAMAQVGEAAGGGRTPPPQALQRLEQLSQAEPLAAEPFLVHSALAQREGAFGRAERLLVHSRNLAPRSPAARFLLADLYLRNGRVLPGLAEMSVLGRLVPDGRRQVAPSLAAYATTPGAAPHLKRVLAAYPELEQDVLSQLAENPDNAELILSIARPAQSDSKPAGWQAKLLNNLVRQGSFARAHSVWAQLSGVPKDSSRGLFNPAFDQMSPPPPFNWALESSGKGVAEPTAAGLQVIYYGREDAPLTRQLMVLPPGRYRLQMNLSGEIADPSAIFWLIRCQPDGQQLLRLPLADAAGNALSGDFAVPAGSCPAQQIELRGSGREFPQTADFRISGLQLARLGQ